MLDDTPRKVLRIICNSSKLPSVAELARRAGRTQGQIKMALLVLAANGFIKYNPAMHNELQIIKAWEVEISKPREYTPYWNVEMHPGGNFI